MKVEINEIRETLEGIIRKYGAPKVDAKILADQYLEGELQGKRSHGLAAFLSFPEKKDIVKKKFKIVKESESFIFIDANGAFGALVGMQVLDSLIARAGKQGVAVASIQNMSTWLRPGTLAEAIAKQGMVGFVINTGGTPMVAPPGGFEPVVGTNPIGIGIPTKNGPMVTDMATSNHAWGEVREAARIKKDLPPESYFDKTGNVTTDPAKAHSARATGDYKGFSLSLFIEIMAGSFNNMPVGPNNKGDYGTSALRGGLIVIFDPAFTVGQSAFLSSVQDLVDKIKDTKPRAGEQVTLPGDRAQAIRKQNTQNGYLEIEDSLWEQIKNLC